MTRKQTSAILLLIASVIYDLIPADLIPDIPVMGWVDDMLVTSSALINCIQQFSGDDNPGIQKILRWLKWALIILVLIVIAATALLTSLVVSCVRG